MSTWHQACSIDGKIRTFEVLRETPKTLAIWSRARGKEIFIKKDDSRMPCFATWQGAHAWLLAVTKDALDRARNDLALAQRDAPDMMEVCRYRLRMAQGLHGNVKGLKDPEP